MNNSIQNDVKHNQSSIVKSSLHKVNEIHSKSINLPKRDKQDTNLLKSSRSDINSIKTELLIDDQANQSIDTSKAQESGLNSSTKSNTIDSLFETLKELEKTETFPSQPRSSNSLYESNDTIVEENCTFLSLTTYFQILFIFVLFKPKNHKYRVLKRQLH